MNKKTFVYISSWKKKNGGFGLSGYEFNSETGEMQLVEQIEKDINFNVTYYNDKNGVLYALEESMNLPSVRGGGGGGRIFVFRVDSATGKLTKIDCTPVCSANPSYLTLDATGKFLIVSTHGSKAAITKIGKDAFGNYCPIVEHDDVAVELFSVNEDGTLGRLLDVVKHYGCGPEARQVIAHPHTTVMSPSGKLFAVCDKGNDTVGMYMLDEEKGKLICPRHIYQHAPGTMPRYCVFHPEKPWFYQNNENNADVNAFSYDENGALREIGTGLAVPADCKMEERILEQQGFAIDSTGRYIYDVVRGPNVVTVFEVDQNNGSLQAVQNLSVNGMWPRGCAISPDGKFLLVCGVESEKILEYAIGPDGRLCNTGNEYPNAGAAYAIFCEV